ncbi:MAG: hypothetical protein EZS28_026635 [Streblomastix strix]|uniref:Uncharacterized protein n=1 Tax=Streblomastix strix TaxID=222440 RepID=A0A5J4V4Z0_9EUKA|nr:MAG: hypothetical protein EZS28_026635 [Streblomastix strix]
MGTTEQDITDIKNNIDTINQELSRQTYFRGYYLLNTDIQNLPDSASGDFSFSAEHGTVWMYDQNWYNSGDIVLDQVTPAGDTTPLSDGTATAGISTEYSRRNHVHPLNITTTIPPNDSASGSVGTTYYYAINDHSHPHYIITSIPPQDSASGSVCTTNYYARNGHSHPIKIQTNVFIIPIVNGVGANGTSAFYARHDHVHPQQLTYDGNVTDTKFIKTGRQKIEVLCANGDTKAISDIDSDSVKKTGQSKQSIAGNYNEGLRIVNTTNNLCLISLGCDPNSISGAIANQWSIFKKGDGTLNIVHTVDQNNANKGLQISADGNTLTFNGSVIAGTGATNGATNGSVNYSAGNPILWGVNRVDSIGGFNSDGAKVYWRAKPLTMGSIPP